MKRDTILMGAAAFGPGAVTIWDGFKAWFNKKGLPFEYILYNTYDRQISELLLGHIDVAWNDPGGWIRSQRMAAAEGRNAKSIIMRDADFDVASVLVVRNDSSFQSLADLKGKTIAVGNPSSVESTMLPVFALKEAGLEAGKDYNLLVCGNADGGYRPWIMDGEVAAAKAVLDGKADAAGLSEANYVGFGNNGIYSANDMRVLAFTPKYDHCNLTYLESPNSVSRDLVDRMTTLFLEMSYDDPELKQFMELEYVKQWKPGRDTHYETINQAWDYTDSIAAKLMKTT